MKHNIFFQNIPIINIIGFSWLRKVQRFFLWSEFWIVLNGTGEKAAAKCTQDFWAVCHSHSEWEELSHSLHISVKTLQRPLQPSSLMESQSGVGWKGPYRSANSSPLTWAGMALTRWGCSWTHLKKKKDFFLFLVQPFLLSLDSAWGIIPSFQEN